MEKLYELPDHMKSVREASKGVLDFFFPPPVHDR